MLAYFQEEQRFVQWWIYLVPVFFMVFTAFVTIQQLVFATPIGNNPVPNGQLWILWIFALGIFWLIWSVRLSTEIDATGIHVRLKPFTRTNYSWDQIERIYLRKYRPLREYGGYGLRFGSYGKAYNIAGNEGIQLELKNGKKILIGTQRWGDAEKVIRMVEERHLHD